MSEKEQVPQESLKAKSFLQTILEDIDWKDIYEEHYGKKVIDKELPVGKDLQKHFYHSQEWFNRINKKKCGE